MNSGSRSTNPIFLMEFPGCDGAAVRGWILSHLSRSQVCWVYAENSLPDLRERNGAAVWLPPRIAAGLGLGALRTFDLVYGQFAYGFHPNNLAQPHYLAFLREPRARLVAVLDEIAAGQLVNAEKSAYLKEQSDADTFLRKYPVKWLDNGIVRRLANAGSVAFGELDDSHLQVALDRARANLEVALVDDRERVVELLAERLGVQDPDGLPRPRTGRQRVTKAPYGIDPDAPYLRLDRALIDTLSAEGFLKQNVQ